MSTNAEAGPSRSTKPLPRPPISASTVTSYDMSHSPDPPSPLNTIEDVDEKNVGVSKNGLSVNEDGEVSKIPAFLTKLYNMVSDPISNELIYWSNKGDSFFVPNQEAFAKTILPRFFKHSNFSSFVRQLNMYAFHKVPHLNSSVMSSENVQELWEFVNPLFKRGQPELLGRIVRKQRVTSTSTMPISSNTTNLRSTSNQPVGIINTAGGPQPVHLITDGTTPGEANASGMLIGPTGQQMLDLSALTNHIANIQRTQGTIAADLKALKASNEHLWKEHIDARETQKKHQETIDLIVSFLERLFGTDGEGLNTLKEALKRSRMGRTREDNGPDETTGKKRRRLGLDRMIGDGRPEDNQVVEIINEPSPRYASNYGMPRLARGRSRQNKGNVPDSADDWSATSQRFTTLPSESESPSQPNSAASQRPSANTNDTSVHSPLPTLDAPATANTSLAPYQYSHNNQLLQPPLSPKSTANAAAAYNLDPAILSTTIGSLLQSPAAAQMFLNSLNNSIQGQALHSPQIQMKTQQQQQSSNSFPFHSTSSSSYGNSNESHGVDPTLALLSPLPQHHDIMQHQNDLTNTYQNAADMDSDVNRLQESIDELVRSMGLERSNGDLSNGGNIAHQLDPQGYDLMEGYGHNMGNNMQLPELKAEHMDSRGGTESGLSSAGASGHGSDSTNTATATGTGNTPLELPEGFNVDDFLRSLEAPNMDFGNLGE